MFSGFWKANNILRFQERVFSARRLIFLDGRVYFENDHECYSEDLSLYEGDAGILNLGRMSTNPFLRFTV